MCFRPAALDVNTEPYDCECGETLFPLDGILPVKCPYCGRPIEQQPPVPNLAAPGAPKMPPPPGAPMAPTPPGVPQAPNPPGNPR